MARSSTSFKKGQSGNPGGMPAQVAHAARELREALEGDAKEIHAALMAAVRDGNVPAIIYAHQQLIGKPKDRVEVSGTATTAIAALTREELLEWANAE